MLTISPACLVLHTRVKLHQYKHLQMNLLTLFLCHVCYIYITCTWSDGRRLKSAGGFVITYRLLEESAEVSFLSRNLVAKNSLDHSKLGMRLYMWSNCYYSKQMLLFLVEVTNKIKDSEGLFIIRIIYCV